MNTAIKRERQRTIRELVARGFVGSQEELAAALRDRGFSATQATISRDIAELGLVRIARGERHLYLTPEDLGAGAPHASDDRLRRILAEDAFRVGRSGLTLLVIGSPGTANVSDEARLERWLERFTALGGRVDLRPSVGARRPRLTALPGSPAPLTEAHR
jgi:transcriptional regulator of arginine metabolism